MLLVKIKKILTLNKFPVIFKGFSALSANELVNQQQSFLTKMWGIYVEEKLCTLFSDAAL